MVDEAKWDVGRWDLCYWDNVKYGGEPPAAPAPTPPPEGAFIRRKRRRPFTRVDRWPFEEQELDDETLRLVLQFLIYRKRRSLNQ